jgi:transposase
MALGRQRDRQSEMLVAWSEMPRSPGHAFHDRLQAERVAAGFEGFVEGLCATHYSERRGRPSLPRGRYVRMLLVGHSKASTASAGWNGAAPAACRYARSSASASASGCPTIPG